MEFDRLAVPNLTKQLKEQDRKRHRDPDAPDLRKLGLPRVWVAYRWSPKPGRWMMLGFVRYPHLSKRRIERVRRKFKITSAAHLCLVDLFEAQRTGGPSGRPPTGDLPKPFTMAPVKLAKTNARTVRRVAQLDPQAVRFIVIGDKRVIDKKSGPVYLGTLFAKTLAGAKREAQRLFSAYAKLFVYDLKELGKFGKRLKRRIVKGRLLAGYTTLLVPT